MDDVFQMITTVSDDVGRTIEIVSHAAGSYTIVAWDTREAGSREALRATYLAGEYPLLDRLHVTTSVRGRNASIEEPLFPALLTWGYAPGRVRR